MNIAAIKDKTANIKAVWGRLKKQKNVKDFFISLPFGFFSSSAKVILILLAFFVFYNEALTGIGLVAAFMEILYIVWFFSNGNRINVKQIKSNVLPLSLTLLLFWSVISAFLSEDTAIAFTGTVYNNQGLFSYFAYAGIFSACAFIKEKKDVLHVLFFHTLCASLVSGLSLCGVYQIDIGAFTNQNHYGYYLCMMLPLALGLFISSDKKYRFIYLIEAMLLTTGLVFCGSMGPFLAVVISVVCFIVFTAILHKKRLWRLLLGVVLCALSGIVSAIGSWDLGADLAKMASDIGVAAAKIGGDTAQETEEAFNKIGSSRGVLWRYAWQFACEKPIFGYGPEGLDAQYYRVLGSGYQPHNEFLQIAASLGFPALGFYLAGLISLFIRFIKRFKDLSPLQLTLFVCVLSYLISSFFGNTKYYTSPYFFMLLGFCFNLSKNENDKIMNNEELRIKN